jgi:hypothetical protein
MINPFTAVINFLVARPTLSHAVIAALETYVLATLATLFKLPYPPILAHLIVSTFYYGREAGQHEHDLKHSGTKPLLAFAGSEFGFLWGLDNLVQWLAALGGSAAVAAALYFFGH